MIHKVSGGGIDLARIEADIKALGANVGSEKTGNTEKGAKGGFGELLSKGIQEVNTTLKTSEKASMDLASGKSSNIHETMLAVTKAELGFNMLVQMRNKALEAYQEVMRMQV